MYRQISNVRAAIIKKIIRKVGTELFFKWNYKYFFGWLANVRVKKQLGSVNFNQGISLLTYKNIDYFLKTNPMDFIEATAMLKNVWEPEVVRVIDTLLQGEKGVFLDIGANIGAITIPLAKKYPDIKFVCVEPNPQVLERLHFNIKLNNLKNVSVVEKILSSEPGKTVSFFAQEYKENSINMGESTLVSNRLKDFRELKFETSTLDEVSKSLLNNQPLLGLKLDVQGHEYDVLLGGKSIISDHKPFILGEFESFHYANPAEASCKINDYLESFKYKTWAVNFEAYNFKPELKIDGSFEGDFLAISTEK